MGDSLFRMDGIVTQVNTGESELVTFYDDLKSGTASTASTSSTRSSASSRRTSQPGRKTTSFASTDDIVKGLESVSVSASSTTTSVRIVVDSPEKTMQRSVMAAKEEHPELEITVEDLKKDPKRAHEMARQLQEKNIKHVIQRLQAARNVSLAFVVDTTGSMDSHINGVKNQIKTIVESISRQHVSVQVAFVGYKDHCDGIDHFEVLPFTTNVPAFQDFVQRIVATGGGDQAEDVLGGLKKSLTDLTWNCNSSNFIFHIADAPPHGRQYQNAGGAGDEYPCGHSGDPKPEELFKMMRARDVEYFFGKINSSTDTMIQVFSTFTTKPITAFNVSDPETISVSVVSAASETITAKREKSMTLLRSASRKGMKPFVYRLLEPNWSELPIVKGSLISYELPETVQSLVRGEWKIAQRIGRFKIPSMPFAHGAERAAFYALEFHKRDDKMPCPPKASDCVVPSCFESDTYTTENMVLKEFLRIGSGTEAEGNRFMNAIETQTAASYLAMQFNQVIKNATGSPLHTLKFLKAKVLRVGSTEPFQYYVVEKRYKNYDAEHFVKLSNNAGHVAAIDSEYLDYAMAFSHWTWVFTTGYMMVVDLQGQRVSPTKLLLTDPAIHSADPIRFNSGTNLGARGFDEFFRTHTCNRFCKALGLKASKAEQMAAWKGTPARTTKSAPRNKEKAPAKKDASRPVTAGKRRN